MKTIIQGNKNISKRIKYFKCRNCGWAGSAEEKEYKCGPQWEPGYYVTCPCCKNSADEVTNASELCTLIQKESNLEW